MRALCIACSLLASYFVYAQPVAPTLATGPFTSDSVYLYLFGRGSDAKSGLLSAHFNLTGSRLSHIGIGILVDTGIAVAHVVNDAGSRKSALRVEPVSVFLSEPGTRHASIWRRAIHLSASHKINHGILELLQETITFDYDFHIGGRNRLYCSEFCAMLLCDVFQGESMCDPVLKKLGDPLFEAYLNRKEFVYYPVDFFIPGGRFALVWEWNQ